MVNRPPPAGGGSGGMDSDGDSIRTSRRSSTGRRSQSGLEWSLRSMHKIDNSSQHFLTNYYGDDSDDNMMTASNGTAGRSSRLHQINEDEEDQTAFEIFKGETGEGNGNGGDSNNGRKSVWDALHAPLRTGVVDGQKKIFELLTDVTKRPETPRKDRILRKVQVINSNRSRPEVRWRFWLMKFRLDTLTAAFFVAFIGLNVVFAGLFYALPLTCCGDETLTYADNFAFSIQTSTTIGYGSLSPDSVWADFLVVFLSYISTLMNTLFAGLLFTKFVTPVINVQFSEVMTLCNVNGVPCLSLQLGNADAHSNHLTDINVRLSFSYQIPYKDHKGEEKLFQQTDELKLLSNRRFGLAKVWTLRHVLDETSPLFGLNFSEHPADKIYEFNLSVDAVQDLTKCSVNIQTEYGIEDILIGRQFVNHVIFDKEKHTATYDYSKMSDTEPYPVWYPAKAGAYAETETPNIKQFKP